MKNTKIFNVDNEIIKEQLYSFVKSYFAAFLTIVYFADANGIDIFTLDFLISSAKASTLVIMRNLYKLVTEKK